MIVKQINCLTLKDCLHGKYGDLLNTLGVE